MQAVDLLAWNVTQHVEERPFQGGVSLPLSSDAAPKGRSSTGSVPEMKPPSNFLGPQSRVTYVPNGCAWKPQLLHGFRLTIPWTESGNPSRHVVAELPVLIAEG